MTICFSGNSFKYEVEAVMKLFFPVTNFTFLFEEIKTEGDYCIIRAKQTKHFLYCFVTVSENGTRKRLCKKVEGAKAYSKQCELTLCQMLYRCLTQLTKRTQPWGCLTGIRPVKEVNSLISKGLDKENVFSALKEKYSVSDEKLELAYRTSVTQSPLLIPPPRSFSLYVSIPFCPTRCSYCSFVSHSMDSAVKLIPQYIEKLCEEIAITAEYTQKLGLALDTIYFGGGTPTSVTAEQLETIMRSVRENFTFSSLREYTVEAGRADTITFEKLCAIKENGATRISINPQTMNDDVLKAIGRNHTAAQVAEAYTLARKAHLNNINADLIAGLPTDTTESFKDTVGKILALSPESITIHTLTLKRAATLFENADVSGEETAGRMVEYSERTMLENGYNPYYLYRQKNTLGNLENVGYAKKGYESLYNIFIMEETQPIFAVGAAASTKLCDAKSGKVQRIYNYKFPYEYIGKFDILMEKKKDIPEFFSKYPV